MELLGSFLNALLDDEDLHQHILSLEGHDPTRIAMGKSGRFPQQFIARQVAGRSIAKQKNPPWYEDMRIAYPPKQNMGQASQHQAAALKAALCKGRSVADLTGGTGIDAWYMAQSAKRFLYNEPDLDIFQIGLHNLSLLGLKGLGFANQSAEELWNNAEALWSYNTIYLDPSRLEEGRRVGALKEYGPDVTHLPAEILRNKRVLIKLGPMLDLKAIMKALPWVQQVLVVSIKNEVKEVLALNWQALEGDAIQALELEWRGHCFRFHPEMKGSKPAIPASKEYLFEPSAALVKAGLTRQYGQYAGLTRLHPGVSLYYTAGADVLFGKIYRILEMLPGKPEEIKKRYEKGPVDIASRGFDMTAEEIASRYKFKTGGGQMLYFTRIMEDGKERHVCLIVERVFA